jgi:hypothetical protein
MSLSQIGGGESFAGERPQQPEGQAAINCGHGGSFGRTAPGRAIYETSNSGNLR